MPIWGRRDSEPAAEEAHEGEAGGRDTPEPAAGHRAEAREGQARAQDTQEPAGEHQAEEAAPAFWRAQGRTAGSPAPAPAGAGASAVLDEEIAVKGPAPAGTGADQDPPAETGEPVLVEAQELAGDETQEPAVAVAQADPGDSVISAQRWREILVAFVDDPRGSVKMASDAVDEAIDEFVSSVWARQRALASSWQGIEPGTEQLRTALLDYRTLWHQVRQLDLAEKTGGKPAAERARPG